MIQFVLFSLNMLELKTGEEKPSTFPTNFFKSDFINIW